MITSPLSTFALHLRCRIVKSAQAVQSLTEKKPTEAILSHHQHDNNLKFEAHSTTPTLNVLGYRFALRVGKLWGVKVFFKM